MTDRGDDGGFQTHPGDPWHPGGSDETPDPAADGRDRRARRREKPSRESRKERRARERTAEALDPESLGGDDDRTELPDDAGFADAPDAGGRVEPTPATTGEGGDLPPGDPIRRPQRTDAPAPAWMTDPTVVRDESAVPVELPAWVGDTTRGADGVEAAFGEPGDPDERFDASEVVAAPVVAGILPRLDEGNTETLFGDDDVVPDTPDAAALAAALRALGADDDAAVDAVRSDDPMPGEAVDYGVATAEAFEALRRLEAGEPEDPAAPGVYGVAGKEAFAVLGDGDEDDLSDWAAFAGAGPAAPEVAAAPESTAADLADSFEDGPIDDGWADEPRRRGGIWPFRRRHREAVTEEPGEWVDDDLPVPSGWFAEVDEDVVIPPPADLPETDWSAADPDAAFRPPEEPAWTPPPVVRLPVDDARDAGAGTAVLDLQDALPAPGDAATAPGWGPEPAMVLPGDEPTMPTAPADTAEPGRVVASGHPDDRWSVPASEGDDRTGSAASGEDLASDDAVVSTVASWESDADGDGAGGAIGFEAGAGAPVGTGFEDPGEADGGDSPLGASAAEGVWGVDGPSAMPEDAAAFAPGEAEDAAARDAIEPRWREGDDDGGEPGPAVSPGVAGSWDAPDDGWPLVAPGAVAPEYQEVLADDDDGHWRSLAEENDPERTLEMTELDQLEVIEARSASQGTTEHRGLAEEIFRMAEEDTEWQAMAAAMPGVESGVVGFEDVADLRTGEQYRETAHASDLGARVATGLVLAVFLIGSLFVGGAALAIFIGVLALLGIFEFYGTLRRVGFRPLVVLGLVSAGGLLVAAWFHGPIAVPVAIGTTIVFTYFLFAFTPLREDTLVNGGFTVLGVAWVAGTLAFAIPILRHPDFRTLVLAVVVSTVAMDVGAFTVGRTWGRRALAPVLSPNKSVEGLMGGIVLAMGAAVGMGALVETFDMMAGAGIGLVVAVFAPLGDLAESMVKRSLGVKDMGSILPGHGGILDRVDAFLFVLPAIWVLYAVGGFLG